MVLTYSGKKVKFVKILMYGHWYMHISILFYRNPTLVNAVTLDELDDPIEEDNHFLGDNLQDVNPPEDDPSANDFQGGNPPEDDPPADDLQDGNSPEDNPQPMISKTATHPKLSPYHNYCYH